MDFQLLIVLGNRHLRQGRIVLEGILVEGWRFVHIQMEICLFDSVSVSRCLALAESDRVTVAPKLKRASLQPVIRCGAIAAIVHRHGVDCLVECE